MDQARDVAHSAVAQCDALSGSLRDYLECPHRDLTAKAAGFFTWMRERAIRGWFPYGKRLNGAPLPVAELSLSEGEQISGLNFSSQDYLSLTKHPAVCAAAVAAIEEFGVHSAGSTALAGNSRHGSALEHELADFLQMPNVLLFPTGWAAGYGVIRGLVRSTDHVVIDVLAHNCLQEGAKASTDSVHQHRHVEPCHVERLLSRARSRHPDCGILVVTEGTFSMDADSPDIARLQDLATAHGALLVVDIAHDLGCLGQDGTGQLGIQAMLGKVDLVVGSFSKTFSSNGGFVATNSAAVKEYLRYYAPSNTFSNALSPVQIAVVRECLRIVRSSEGEVRRSSLMRAIEALRSELTKVGVTVLGSPSPIVPVVMGDAALARIAVAEMNKSGLVTNLVEFPAVAANAARLRMQVMADHTVDQCRAAAHIVATSLVEAKGRLE